MSSKFIILLATNFLIAYHVLGTPPSQKILDLNEEVGGPSNPIQIPDDEVIQLHQRQELAGLSEEDWLKICFSDIRRSVMKTLRHRYLLTHVSYAHLKDYFGNYEVIEQYLKERGIEPNSPTLNEISFQKFCELVKAHCRNVFPIPVFVNIRFVGSREDLLLNTHKYTDLDFDTDPMSDEDPNKEIDLNL